MEQNKKPLFDINGLRLPDFLKNILRAGTMHVYDAMQLLGHTVNNVADVTNQNWHRLEEFATNLAKNEDERIASEKQRIASEDLRREQEDVREVGEKTRKRNEVWRQENENERISKENQRIEAENERDTRYVAAEVARNASFSDQQQNRDTTFQNSERERDTIFKSKEETRDEANQAALNAAEQLATLGLKTKQVESETTEKTTESVDFYNDDKTERLHHIGEDGADFKNLKSNGKNVLTEHQDISGLATKEDVDKKQDKINQIEKESAPDDSEEQRWESDDKSETYASVGSYGIKSKAYLDMDGNPIGDNRPEVVRFNEAITSVLPQLHKDDNDVSVAGSKIKPITLLQFSDVHGNGKSLQRIVEFANYYNKDIDTILHTGDTVSSKYSDGISFFNAVSGSNKILNCVGNHDAYDGTDWQAHAGADCYNMIFAPNIASWGVNYTAGNCYYYKDYAEQKLRLIVLDENLVDTSTEITWLQGLLAQANTLGYAVICASHSYMGGGTKNKITKDNKIVSFARYDDKKIAGTYSFTDACDAIDSFISAGGKFVCWLVGHAHCTNFCTSALYPNQPQVMCDTASTARGCADVARVIGTNSEDSFNLISIDTNVGMFRLVKVGANYDKYMRERKCLCYDYINRVVVSDNGIV